MEVGIHMKTISRLALAAIALTCLAGAQGLKPEVLLLARVKAHTRAALAQLPNCSCLETIRREHQAAGGSMRPMDTVHLEVLYSEGHEYFTSPGDRGFRESDPSAFVAGGTIANGAFALYLSELAAEHGLSYEYRGEETVAGRRAARYDYRVPLSMSGHHITTIEGTGIMAIDGSFWADPETYDVVRVSLTAGDIPPGIPVSEYVTTVDYARTILSGREFLLPQSAEQRLTRFSGEDNRNHVEFTHCRLYGAESSISFAAPEGAPKFGTSSVDQVRRDLPASLVIAVKVMTPITAASAVGTLIEGVVAADVMERKGKVAIPAGATVRGRLRRLESLPDLGGYHIVALEFTELESAGVRYRFFADMLGTDGAPAAQQSLTSVKREEMSLPAPGSRVMKESTNTLTLPQIEGVGSFFVRGQKLDLPVGFRMTWRTRALAR
jgi:hypothetical protein